MPALTVWMVRAALLYLASGFTLGALMLVNRAYPLDPNIWRLLPLHIEMLLIGWMVQLAVAVAFWILPRFSSRADVENRYGAVWLAWLAFALLNAGIAAVMIGSWAGLAPVSLGGRIAEASAAVAFALHAWPRIKPPGA